MTDARAAILARIRSANGGATLLSESDTDWRTILQDSPQKYRVRSELGREALLALFTDRLLDYDATVTCATQQEAGGVLAQVLASAGLRRIGIAAGFMSGELPGGFEFVEDEGLSAKELDSLDGVLTRCTVAIAETGTIVLQAGGAEGRRALTLVPDTHVCLVDESKVVATVPEAFAWLAPTAGLPTTFVSGPSATADIEMTRIKGVHGPRFLHVILVQDAADGPAART